MGRFHATLLGTGSALLVMAGTLFAPPPAHAGSDGRKNTAIALGAGAVAALLGHHPLVGAALGAGAVYAESQYENARRSERDANNRRYYYDRRGTGYPYGSYGAGNRSYNTDQDYPQQYNYSGRWNNGQQYNGNHQGYDQNNCDNEQGRRHGGDEHDTNRGQWKKHHEDNNDQD